MSATAKRRTVARVREYRRFTQSIDPMPRVTAHGQSIDADTAPTTAAYRRPLDSAPRVTEGWR
jgi:hypothetical protein